MSNEKLKKSEKKFSEGKNAALTAELSPKELKKAAFKKYMRKNWQYYFLLLVPVIYYIVIRYIPMAGNIIAFRRYRAGHSIFGDEWSGFKYFKQFIGDTSFWRAFRNTLTLNVFYLVVRFPLTLIFALLLNEIRNIHWKKFVQTVSYLPHFISIVIVTGMIRELLSTTGPINGLIKSLGYDPVTFIAQAKFFPAIYVISGVWQNLGWGTILYLAAISNSNPSLYEAAEVDGASHFQRVWHVTIPCIMPTIATLLILDIGGLVGSGGAFEKVFLLYNPMTYETADIISTYVYRLGLYSGNYSYATAVGLFEGLLNLFLLTIANKVSKRVTGSGLW